MLYHNLEFGKWNSNVYFQRSVKNFIHDYLWRQTNIRLGLFWQHFLAIVITSGLSTTLFSKIRYNREVKRLQLMFYLNSLDFRKWRLRIFILLNTRRYTHRQTNSEVKRLISIISFSFKSASVYNLMFLTMEQEELCRLQAVKESKNWI